MPHRTPTLQEKRSAISEKEMIRALHSKEEDWSWEESLYELARDNDPYHPGPSLHDPFEDKFDEREPDPWDHADDFVDWPYDPYIDDPYYATDFDFY